MAQVYFVDTSALSKRYVTEMGSAWVQGTLHPSSGNVIYIVRIASVELVSAITRRERGRAITTGDATAARNALRAHINAEYKVIEVSHSLVNKAMALAERHGLRGYDAVRLAAAVEVDALYSAQNLPPVALVSSDNELNAAALAEGLSVINPNNYP